MKFILFGILIICLVTRGARSDEDVEEFDPVEAMRSLLEQEVAEGESFRQQLRQQGVNVEEWEEKFSQEDLELHADEQDNVREELWFLNHNLQAEVPFISV